MSEQETHELEVPPHWVFQICVEGEPTAQVYGAREKRNWVMWKISQYVVGLAEHGDVSVRQLINGEWHERNNWHNLGH